MGDGRTRWEKIAPLGRGGGGEVWEVRDRATGSLAALKLLAREADAGAARALVREAVALGALEGLGLPRVRAFGRTRDGRPWLVRDRVVGTSLAAMLEAHAPARACLDAVGDVSLLLTRIHRAGLLHGDVKPSNVIVGPGGQATLVDLGLAVPWRALGARPDGLTPRYAAPELYEGGPLGVRTEVFALGVTLGDVLEAATDLDSSRRDALAAVVARATSDDAAARYPSAEELGAALHHAAGFAARPPLAGADDWRLVGAEAIAARVLEAVTALPAGGVLRLVGPQGSGRTTLLRRTAWSLGIAGHPVAHVEASSLGQRLETLLEADLGARGDETYVLVDDAAALGPDALATLEAARARGARLALVADERLVALDASEEVLLVPPLDEPAARALLEHAVPSMPPRVVAHALARAGARPGSLRALVRRVAGMPLVTPDDLDRALAGTDRPPRGAFPAEVARLLDHGRFDDAAAELEVLAGDRSLEVRVLAARLALGRGDAARALAALGELSDRAPRGDHEMGAWTQRARAELRLGRYADASASAERVLAASPAPSARADALSVVGLAASYLGDGATARTRLDEAVATARAAGDARVLSVALASLGLALQRAGAWPEARAAYEEALAAAEAADDAGSVAPLRLNLASLAQAEGDPAGALAHLDAAVDMGRRAGRSSTVAQALLNLANLDLSLGRHARARSSLDALALDPAALGDVSRAQWLGLEAEWSARAGDATRAAERYEACAVAYDQLGRRSDAAEARLERALLAARADDADAAALAHAVDAAAEALAGEASHAPLVALARAEVRRLAGDETGALDACDEALAVARATERREWVARVLEARARLAGEAGQPMRARRDAEEALSLHESFAARLPRDLREVYWDDPRRRALREVATPGTTAHGRPAATTTAHAAPPDDRLVRILSINRELAAEHDLARLLERVVDHAIALTSAERGFVILADDAGELVVHASRDRGGDDPHARFSRSIAERVVRSGEAVVSRSARDDDRMADFISVHQLMLQSVACVPIRAPAGPAVGALYVETRIRPGARFDMELPALAAFADQAAIAIENARLVTESARRATELAESNRQLVAAHERLEEALGRRTAQLDATRRDLRSTREVLRGHFGWRGLVGTSEPMRRLYALVSRVKDTDVPVLLTGESGTGKELVARALHEAGPRGKKPFLAVNCGAIPESLLESELFGHVRGAFTGADRDRRGVFREAEGGTLLLDEIGEMPHKMQAGLLRVLQERVVRPVGGARELPVDVRVIAATNRDLAQMVAAGTFRDDLFFRLNVVEVRLPPLRERPGDIPPLVDHFLGIFAARFRRERKTVSREAMRKLQGVPWPGNVRQLENVLLNAWVTSDESELGPDDFDLAHPAQRRPALEPSQPAGSLALHRDGEKERVLAALAACNWNRVRAAAMVGMPRRTFYRRLKEFGIQ